jgi:hypothetical protein
LNTELPAGLGKGQVTEFIMDDEVRAGQVIDKATLANVARLGFQLVERSTTL